MTRTGSSTSTARKTARPSAAARATARQHAEDAPTPRPALLDIPGALSKLKLPGIDISALIDSRRKDVEAVLAANEQAYRGLEAVAKRQREMLTEAMKSLRASTEETLATQGAAARAGRIAGQAQQALGQALADMKELAELSARSQQQVVQTLGKRLRDGINEASTQLASKKK